MSKKILMAAILSMVAFFYSSIVYAESVQNSKLVTGTKQLFQDATAALLILAPIFGVLLIIYFLIRKSAADEVDQKKWNTRITIVVICVVGCVLASALINVIISYYQ
jgi:heme/copper-type cytochrome/quinol oxidase subunit 2